MKIYIFFEVAFLREGLKRVCCSEAKRCDDDERGVVSRPSGL